MKYLRGFIFCMWLALSQPMFANDLARIEAEKLLATLDMESVLQKSIETTLDLQLQQKPELVKFRDVMLKFLNKYMSYTSLKPDLVAIYSTEFTADELIDLRKFYETPTGKKAVQKMPALLNRGAQIGSKKVQENIQVLQQMLMEEMQKTRQ